MSKSLAHFCNGSLNEPATAGERCAQVVLALRENLQLR
jgi:hypothetical protein